MSSESVTAERRVRTRSATSLVSGTTTGRVVSFGAAGEAFDPQLHNAVMHVEDEALGENVIAEVFQKGFKVGDKVVRFAMVKVAN